MGKISRHLEKFGKGLLCSTTDFIAQVQFSWGPRPHVALSGFVRDVNLRCVELCFEHNSHLFDEVFLSVQSRVISMDKRITISFV